tara:strand:+ start:1000 stop:1134 length:135 start_codon:yes stop_codon:yes gene_type:complete
MEREKNVTEKLTELIGFGRTKEFLTDNTASFGNPEDDGDEERLV